MFCKSKLMRSVEKLFTIAELSIACWEVFRGRPTVDEVLFRILGHCSWLTFFYVIQVSDKSDMLLVLIKFLLSVLLFS